MDDAWRQRDPAPTLIGIGAQKCASSWIHAAIAAHPQAGAAREKELDYFSYRYDHGHAWYRAQFAGMAGRRARFECSPSYFHDPRSPARAAAFDPALGVVAILRDPVERAFSNHLHEVIKGHIPPCRFEAGLANNPSYLEQGRYATHLSRWLEAFPGRVLVLIAEEIAADPEAEAARLYRFAGLDPALRPGVLAERRNESDRARIPLLRLALRAQGSAMRRAGLEETLIRIKRLPGIAHLMRANARDMRALIPPMAAATRARLIAEFAPEIREVARLIGRERLPWPAWEAAAGEPAAGPVPG